MPKQLPGFQPDTDIARVLSSLIDLTRQLNELLIKEAWTDAVACLNARHPLIQQLETCHEAGQRFDKQTPNWSEWLDAEHKLAQQMTALNNKQVNLEQVFLQIQTARQQLLSYRIDARSTSGNAIDA